MAFAGTEYTKVIVIFGIFSCSKFCLSLPCAASHVLLGIIITAFVDALDPVGVG